MTERYNIIYVANTFTERAFRKYFTDRRNLPGQAAAKYSRLLAEGLAMQDDVSVTVISEMPADETNCAARLTGRKTELFRGVKYVYLPLVNIHRVKDILSVITAFLETIRYIRNGRSAVVADILAAPAAFGGYLAARIKRVPYVALVTDFPEYEYGPHDRAYRTVSEMLLASASHYVFLTGEMNIKVNDHKRPYAVIEGMADIRQKSRTVGDKKKDGSRTILYTGSLDRKYGIEMLTEAFIKADIKGTELHICGSGEMAEELRQASDKNDKIIFHGSVPSDEAVKMQKAATLLVNPRPSHPEYTKYSFPSKTTEYMSSGTAVLMTDLPGVPDEYKEHVYIIDDESVDGIADSLTKVLSKPDEELEAKAMEAYEFVLNEKNNKIQAEKVMGLLK